MGDTKVEQILSFSMLSRTGLESAKPWLCNVFGLLLLNCVAICYERVWMHGRAGLLRGAWVAQSVRRLPSAQVLGSGPTSGSLLSGESASLSPPAPPPHSCSLSRSLSLK